MRVDLNEYVSSINGFKDHKKALNDKVEALRNKIKQLEQDRNKAIEQGAKDYLEGGEGPSAKIKDINTEIEIVEKSIGQVERLVQEDEKTRELALAVYKEFEEHRTATKEAQRKIQEEIEALERKHKEKLEELKEEDRLLKDKLKLSGTMRLEALEYMDIENMKKQNITLVAVGQSYRGWKRDQLSKKQGI